MATYTGLFEEGKKDEQISKLKKEIKDLKAIDKSHQKLNGELRADIEKLKKENQILQEGNDALNLYRDDGIGAKLEEIVRAMVGHVKVAKPLIDKYPRNKLFSTAIRKISEHAVDIHKICKKIKNKIN